MDKELALLKPLLYDAATITLGDTDYSTGRIGRHDVVLCKCGIGKVNAALGTAALIDNFHPGLIINSGVAGGTGYGKPALKVLDVLMPDAVAYHDVWCGPGTNRGQIQGFPAVYECPFPNSIRASINAHGGLLASGDVFIDSEEDVRRVRETQPEAVAVDMESAAIAQTCFKRAVPFVCVRVISDAPGERNFYEEFWTKAPETTFHVIEQLLQIL